MSVPIEKLSREDRATIRLLQDDYDVYAEEVLEIKTKSKGIQPLKVNFVQKVLNQGFDEMLKEVGLVRYIIVKGRQQTCSTNTVGRFFHIAQFEPATDVLIMSHETKSTKGLFDKITLFNEAAQRKYPSLSFGTETENRQELEFSNKSTFKVATAGEGNTGRSLTASKFLGSEPAFWEKPEEIKAGALQTVALDPGTWVIFESTANGMNWFYHMCIDARKGIGIYRLLFIPWVWTEEYQYPAEKNFVRTREESQVAETLFNVHGWTITNDQLMWRRIKIAEIGPRMFKQEYPNTFEEAFQYSKDSFFDMDLVYKAMNTTPFETFGARVMGVDVGRDRVKNPNGKPDRTVLVRRQGQHIYSKVVYEEMSSTRLAGILCDIIDKGEIDHIFIDRAIGGATYEIMCERGYGRWITCVDFGESPIDDQYANKRAEIHCLFEEALRKGMCIVNDPEISTDISMMPYWELNSNSRKLFPEKKKLKELYGRSPDVLDAIVLTYSFPVASDIHEEREVKHTRNTRDGSALTAQRELRKYDSLANRGSNSYPGTGMAPKPGSRTPGRRFT